MTESQNDPPNKPPNPGQLEPFEIEFPEVEKRSPKAKQTDRYATATSGLNVAAHAVGLEHHQANLKQYERMQAEAWRMGQGALYEQNPGKIKKIIDDVQAMKEEEESGIHISGDHHTYIAADASQDTTGHRRMPEQPQQPENKPANNLLPWVLTAAMAGVGGTAAIMSLLPKGETPPAESSDTTERTYIGLSTGEIE